MDTAVAAGDPQTAQAAADVLDAGGNAIDAAIAACAASFVAEPLLASPGGAGILVAALPDEAPFAVDFFSSAPWLDTAPTELDFHRVDIDFGAAIQSFHVGRGSVAVPLAFEGLAAAHQKAARLPLHRLMEPAIALARNGAVMSAQSADVFRLLWPIQELSNEARAYAGGAIPHPGKRLRNTELASLLEEFGRLGQTPSHFVRGILSGFGPKVGGWITQRDIDHAKAAIVEPRTVQIGPFTLVTSPKLGGTLLQAIAERLLSEPQANTEAESCLHIAEACRQGHRLRIASNELGSTTHISILDAQGGMASVTLTNGEGCGYLVPGTGVQLNNFLGEEDLNPRGFHKHAPGAALPTMVAPTIILRDGYPVLALGSGGSNRIRSVVAQVLTRVLRGADLKSAVLAPRIHAEEDDVWLEMCERDERNETATALRKYFERVHTFDSRAFFFGGVHSTAIDRAGQVHAFGDPRRGGAAIVSRR